MYDWLWILLGSICSLACFFLIVMFIDGNRFRVVSYKISSDRIKNTYRLVLLADLHDRCYGIDNEAIVRKIQDFQPDLLLMAGDMLTAKKGFSYDHTLKLCGQLAKEYPVYYSMGNHESRLFCRRDKYGHGWENFEDGLKKAGAVLLRNQGEAALGELYISGLEIDWEYYRHFQKKPMEESYLHKVLGEPDKDRYQILLAHNPDYFPEYVRWGANLVLSGHVHGGIMRLPFLGGVINPALQLFPKYDGGCFLEGRARMILSRGLGMHTLPVRIFNPGELVFITLVPEKSREEKNGFIR